MLKKAFRSAGTVIGEAIVALVGIGTIYGLGWVSGARSGAKLSEVLNRAMDDEEKRKAAEAAASKEEEEEQQEETVTEEVADDNQPED